MRITLQGGLAARVCASIGRAALRGHPRRRAVPTRGWPKSRGKPSSHLNIIVDFIHDIDNATRTVYFERSSGSRQMDVIAPLAGAGASSRRRASFPRRAAVLGMRSWMVSEDAAGAAVGTAIERRRLDRTRFSRACSTAGGGAAAGATAAHAGGLSSPRASGGKVPRCGAARPASSRFFERQATGATGGLAGAGAAGEEAA